MEKFSQSFHLFHFEGFYKIEFLKFFEQQYMRQTKQCIITMKFPLKV